jgi:hypothetical protein
MSAASHWRIVALCSSTKLEICHWSFRPSEVDGHRYQDGTTKNLIFSVPAIIAYMSRFFELEPGDVIATGTPATHVLGQPISWPVQYLRAAPEGSQARVAVDLKNLDSCFEEHHAVPER